MDNQLLEAIRLIIREEVRPIVKSEVVAAVKNEVQSALDNGLKPILKRLHKIENRLDALEVRFDSLDVRVGNLETRMDSMGRQIIDLRADMNQGFRVINSRLRKQDEKLDAMLEAWTIQKAHRRQLDDHEVRISAVEHRVMIGN